MIFFGLRKPCLRLYSHGYPREVLPKHGFDEQRLEHGSSTPRSSSHFSIAQEFGTLSIYLIFSPFSGADLFKFSEIFCYLALYFITGSNIYLTLLEWAAPFETGYALLRDAEMGRIPEERSIPYGPSGSKGAAHRKGAKHIMLWVITRKLRLGGISLI